MKNINLEFMVISLIFHEKINVTDFTFNEEMFENNINYQFVEHLQTTLPTSSQSLFEISQYFISKNEVNIYDLDFVNKFLMQYDALTILDSFYHKSIEKIWNQRKLNDNNSDFLTETLELLEDMKANIEHIQSQLKKEKENPYQTFKNGINELKDKFENGELEEGIVGLKTGISELNIITSGFKPGNYILLAGRPSMGKTSLGLDIVVENLKANKRVLVLSVEMPAEQLIARIIPKINPTLTLDNTINAKDIEAKITDIENASDYLEKTGLEIEDFKTESIVTLNSVTRRIEKYFKDHGVYPDFILLDYIQIVKSLKHMTENELMTHISGTFQRIAKKNRCVFMALSQLNRSLEERKDKRPINSDLRSSGSLEQDADMILFVYRHAVYLEKKIKEDLINKPDSIELAEALENLRNMKTDISEIIVSKNRNGKVGTAMTKFFKPAATYTDFPEMFENDF